MKDADQKGVTFFETVDAHNGPEDDDEVCGDEHSKNGASFFSVVEEDFRVGEPVDGDAGHGESDNEDDEGTKTGNSLEAADEHL